MPKTQSRKKATRKVTSSKSLYVARHRQRLKRNGLRRVEVAVKPRDISLLKSIASALCADGLEAERLRANMHLGSSMPKAKTGAEFIAMMKKLTPFGEDICFERDNIQRPFFSFE
jgi:hypothetical protein